MTKQIGLALGAGAARGLAHIGVLKMLEENNIKINYIAGTSIGSLIGGLYAAGMPIKFLKGLATEINWDLITDITFSRQGLIKGDKLFSFLEIITRNKNIEDLLIPFSAIACDIENGEHIIIDKGSLASAIRASTSIPGIYKPFPYMNRVLVDGGLLERVPVDTVRKMGADMVIAVDLREESLNRPVKNIFDILVNTFDIMQREMDKYKKLEADIIIRPDLSDISSFDLERADECILSGYKAARSAHIQERIE